MDKSAANQVGVLPLNARVGDRSGEGSKAVDGYGYASLRVTQSPAMLCCVYWSWGIPITATANKENVNHELTWLS